MVVGLGHEQRHSEIEHEKMLDRAQGKIHKGKKMDSSQPDSSNYNSDRKMPYDIG
jgi:hypothetical protein